MNIFPALRRTFSRRSLLFPDMGIGVKKVGFWLGPLLFAVMMFTHPAGGMETITWHALALAMWMITWWVTEAIPLSATALLPVILLPMLEIVDIRTALAPYANPVIFLFLGGFIIAIGIEKSELHKRIALNIVRLIGTRPDRMIGGFMAACAFLSMWISNTASMLMMLPIALSIIALMKDKAGSGHARDGEIRRFSTALLLGLAFASSVGGIGTIIGTPPNAILSGYLNVNHQYTIPFLDWMLVGVPMAVCIVAVMWVVMTKVLFRIDPRGFEDADAMIRDEISKLGPMSREEKIVSVVACCTALLWITRSFIAPYLPFTLNDTIIAMMGGLALFIIPTDRKHHRFLLSWKDAEKKLPWGVLILFGGGLSLAAGFQASGLGEWIGKEFSGISDWHPLLMLVVVTATIQLATSLMSNVATINIFVPIIVPLAIANGVNPLFLAIPATISASCAFMLPVSTANNAIAFGTGRVNIKDMVLSGLVMNIIALVIIVILTYAIMMPVLDIQPGVIPDWAHATGNVLPEPPGE